MTSKTQVFYFVKKKYIEYSVCSALIVQGKHQSKSFRQDKYMDAIQGLQRTK